MQYWTVGQVAQRSQLTVRTLHHYDAMGLVKPSGRSASGYRLYSPQDVARLHAVLALKQLGLSLEAIQEVLRGEGLSPVALVERQVVEAQRALEQAQAWKDKLLLVRDNLLHQSAPGGESEALFAAMELMHHYQQFLPVEQVRKLLARWRKARTQWEPLAQALSAYQRRGEPVDSPEVQRLAQQWMNVAMSVFGGQLAVIQQWAHMHQHAPQTAAHMGIDTALLGYLEQVMGARMAALLRHMTPQELQKLDGSLAPEWMVLAQKGEALLAVGTRPHSAAAQVLAQRYAQLLACTVRQDAALAQKMRKAYAAEPILAHGHFVTPALRIFLDRALDPHAT